MKDKILILAADLEQVLPIAKSLYVKGFEIHGIFSSKLSYGYGSRYIKRKYIHQNAAMNKIVLLIILILYISTPQKPKS